MKTISIKYKSLPVQIRASFWFLICAFFQKGISFITTPIFTRILSTEEYGQFNVFTSWKNVLTVIVTLNLFAGVYVRGLVKYNKERSVFSSALQGLTLTLVLFWTVIYLLFHDFFNSIFNLTSTQMLLMFATIWTSAVFAFWSMEQRVDNKYKALVGVTIIVSIAKPLLCIVLVLFSRDKVTARILGIAIVEIIIFTGMFFLQMKQGKVFFEKSYWRHALFFNIPLIPHYLSTSILNSADCIMIEKIVCKSAAGIYSLAYSISMIMTIFNTALIQTIEPWLYKKIDERNIKEISKVAYLAFIFVAIVNLGLIAIAPEMVSIFAPKEYRRAIYVIPPVAMSVYFMFSYVFFAVFEFYFKKTNLVAIGTTAGALLNILLNFIFINKYGYIAAGYTTLICYIAYAGFHFYFMRKICNNKFNGIQPYSIRIYVAITGFFLLFGFMLLICYDFVYIRVCAIFVLIVLMILNKGSIITFVKSVLIERGKSKE